MLRFIFRRLLFLALTLFLTSILIFLLTRVLPGDVPRVLLGREASESQVASLRIELGLDRPLPIQYVDWVGEFLTQDWGATFSTPRQPIRALVMQRLGRSAILAMIALLLSIPLAILLGVVAALTA